MGEISLSGLEKMQGEANQKFLETHEAAQKASEKAAAAEEAFYKAAQDYTFGDMSDESFQKKEAAQKAMEEAKAEAQAAEKAMEEAAAEAQAAAEAVENKKEELRRDRDNDTTYVVHCARIECSKGMRESYLVLGPTHGVKTRQIPQMTIKDILPFINVINFGGCFSTENPSVKAAAEAAVEAAQKAIEDKHNEKGCIGKFFDNVVDFFVGDHEMNVDESLMQQCVGECLAGFPENPKWEKGHEKVTVNGEPVLLRRCSLTCNYGGCITILVSGQPE